MTGPFLSQPFSGQVQMQLTGFPSPLPFQFAQPFQPTQQLSTSPTNNFATQSQQVPQHRPFSTFIPQQATGLPSGPTSGFLQPQPTGANPFRQSVLVPQATGMPSFVASMPPPLPLQAESLFQLTNNPPSQSPGQPMAQFGQVRQSLEVPARPASTPLASIVANPSSASPPIAQPVKSHQTGSRNPFGVPVTPAPPVPKPPTLLELSMGLGRLGVDGSQPVPPSHSTVVSNQQIQGTTAKITESTFSAVASSFAFSKKLEETPSPLSNELNRLGSHPPNSYMVSINTSSSASDSLFSSLSQTTNSTGPSHTPSIPAAGPIKTHSTGFGGVKPFKPTSSFGASLLETLPPIPQSGTTTPDPSAHTTTSLSTPSFPMNTILNGTVYASTVGKDNSIFGTINPQPTGAPLPSQRVNGSSTPGVGLRPQATGTLGAANPFRATMFATTSAPPPNVSSALTSSTSTPLYGVLSNGTGAFSGFGPGFGHGAFGPPFTHLSRDGTNTQQNAGTSLI